jgi:hypothetical protein
MRRCATSACMRSQLTQFGRAECDRIPVGSPGGSGRWVDGFKGTRLPTCHQKLFFDYFQLRYRNYDYDYNSARELSNSVIHQQSRKRKANKHQSRTQDQDQDKQNSPRITITSRARISRRYEITPPYNTTPHLSTSSTSLEHTITHDTSP